MIPSHKMEKRAGIFKPTASVDYIFSISLSG